jgi:hypothetical protein
VKIAIVTDAWQPQTNGVVQTLNITIKHLRRFGHQVQVIEPGLFRTVACPTYPEIRLAWLPYCGVNRLLRDYDPQAVHIATEGTRGAGAGVRGYPSRPPITPSFPNTCGRVCPFRWR